jgi:methylmalonyl-CoA mutase
MMTKRDPWVNMLRTTIAAFSAGLGGADAISVLPFTAALGLPDRFARRIARNMQLLLLEESNLARVVDPAAGSGGIEDLTEKLCRTAWALFQEIEAAGGAAAALSAGLIQQQVTATRANREKAVALRQDVLTGTSDFPDLAEVPVNVLVPSASALSTPAQASTPLPNPPPQGGREQKEFAPLPRLRLAEPYERLREASDRMLAATGARPKVFLANLGTPADFNTRANFAKNFFEAGGIEAPANEGFLSSPLPAGESIGGLRPPFLAPRTPMQSIGYAPKASGEGEPSSLQRHNPSPGPSPSAPDRPLPMGEVKSASGKERTNFPTLTAAFKASGAKLACLCSSDQVYEREAAEAAKALAAAGARHIYLAGRPREQAAPKAAGIGTFIFAGCDVLAALKSAHDILGIPTKSPS